MKNIAKIFGLIALVLLLSLPLTARAADPVSIGVVDLQKLLTESAAGKDIQSQMETHKTKFLSEIGAQEQKLREDEKTLTDQRASLPADDFAKKAKDFEEKLNDTRRKAQDRKKALEEAA